MNFEHFSLDLLIIEYIMYIKGSVKNKVKYKIYLKNYFIEYYLRFNFSFNEKIKFINAQTYYYYQKLESWVKLLKSKLKNILAQSIISTKLDFVSCILGSN